MKYRVSEVTGWFIISPAGLAENNEPLRVRYLFHRWLARQGVKVIVDLKEIKQFGVWEVGLLTSFKREVDQRAGLLRICRLNPNLSGYFQRELEPAGCHSARFRLRNSVPPRISGRWWVKPCNRQRLRRAKRERALRTAHG